MRSHVTCATLFQLVQHLFRSMATDFEQLAVAILHCKGWKGSAFAPKCQNGSTKDNLCPEERKGCLDGKSLEKLDLDKNQKLEDDDAPDALFFWQLFFPICMKSGIQGNPRQFFCGNFVIQRWLNGAIFVPLVSLALVVELGMTLSMQTLPNCSIGMVLHSWMVSGAEAEVEHCVTLTMTMAKTTTLPIVDTLMNP